MKGIMRAEGIDARRLRTVTQSRECEDHMITSNLAMRKLVILFLYIEKHVVFF